jgi:uncharacterized protein (DUF983 family)
MKIIEEGIVTDKGCSCPVCGEFTLYENFISNDDGGACLSCMISLEEHCELRDLEQ